MNTRKANGNSERLSVWDFISIVSHQLRNPLASTKLSLEMLLGKELGPLTHDQEEYLRIIRNDNERMVRLVKEFLIISAIERGEIKLNLTEFDFKDLAVDVVAELNVYAAAHNTRIAYHAGEHMPAINGDKLKLRQVISNFIDNAIKYSRPGSVIDVRLDTTKNGKELIFKVEDRGIGIPEKEHEKIFSKFFRSSNASALHPEGAGIGLYIAKAIIEESGGNIGFSSKENEGSTFWFTLPVKK